MPNEVKKWKPGELSQKVECSCCKELCPKLYLDTETGLCEDCEEFGNNKRRKLLKKSEICIWCFKILNDKKIKKKKME